MTRAAETPASTRRPDAPAPDPALTAIERAMVRIRRNQTRRSLGKLVTAQLGRDVDLSHSVVVDAVEE
ncbi:MarR family transcriptional regulator, partial [Kitasatospora sp. NPDC093558]